MGIESVTPVKLLVELMLMSIVIMSTLILCLQIIGFWDSPVILRKKHRFVIAAVIMAESMAIVLLFHGEAWWRQCLFGIFAGSLLSACVTDYLFCKVYNFVWWIGLGTVAGLCREWFLNPYTWSAACIIIRNLAFFAVVQFWVFRKLYGQADVYAFVVCSLAEAVCGLELIGFFCHMLIAWMLLAVVQVAKRNVGRNGNLRRPVAFIPYITLSFWIVLLYKQVLECDFSPLFCCFSK